MLKLKAEITTRIKTYCAGCGLCYWIELISEPVAFENERLLFEQVKHMARELVEGVHKCDNCKKKTKHISRYAEPAYGLPR